MREAFTSWQDYVSQATNPVTQFEAVHWKQFFAVLQRLRDEVKQLRDRIVALEQKVGP